MKIYHNPRCSKSRAAVDLLAERQPDIRQYLNSPLDESEIRAIISRLHQPLHELIRWNDGDAPPKPQVLTVDFVVELLLFLPKLIERPIVDDGTVAVIGRPTEILSEMFG